MKEKLLIIGASGHGKVVADIALKMDKWKSVAFLDDNENIKSSMGIEVVGKAEDAFLNITSSDFFVGIGNNFTREMIQEKLESKGATIATLVHPTAVIGEHVRLAKGTVVMAGSIINCCTSIGKGCIINTGVTIDHDNNLEDYVHVSPGSHVAGSVRIGKKSWLGIGSVITNNNTITERCNVGAGAVVICDITEPGTYVGIPARRLN